MSLKDGLEEWAEQEDLRAELARVSKRLSRERAEKIRLEETIRQAAKAAFRAWPPPKVPKPRQQTRKKGAETVVALCSDWHYGAQTPDFDRDVCEQRVEEYGDKILDLTQIQRADHPVREFRLWLLGDMAAGEDVYLGQAYEVDASAVEQAFGVARIISDLALKLLGRFDRGMIVGVPGNHSLGSTKRSPFHPDTNLDRICYLAAKERLGKVDRLSWNIARAEGGDSGRILVDTVGSCGTLLTHGDLFKGGGYGGLPWYQFWKKTMAWRDMAIAGQMPRFESVACGHWHRTASIEIGTTTLRVSGSLQTYDPYSREQIAAATRPAQSLLFMHPERGVTAEYKVDLGG